jgi:hypothetical protein
MNNEELIKFLIATTNRMVFNLNDCFSYATSEEVEINSEDVEELLPIIAKHGFNAILAYVAVARDETPLRAKEGDFQEAVREVRAFKEQGLFLWMEELTSEI